MTTQFPSPGKSALSPHRYQAEASVLSAHFELPIARDIDKQAHVALPEDGTYTYQAAGAFKFVGLLSFGSGYTQVAGHAGLKLEGVTTHASSVLEHVNVLDVVTADRVIGQISTVHFVDDGNVPSVSFLGTRFENLRISGNPVEIEQDLRILGEKPAGKTSYFEDVGVRTRIARQYEGIRKSSYLPEWAINEFPSRDHRGGGKMKCSLVQRVHGAPWPSFGHVVEVPDFGRIFLGELTVELADSDYIFDLSMIRMELDSVAVGTTRLVNVVCGGGTKLEVKHSLQESVRPSMQQFADNFRRAFMPAMPSHVDPYLLHAFRNSARTSTEEVVYGVAGSDSESIVAMSVPMVLRVNSPSWNSHDFTGFVETSRLGSIVCGRGNAECLTALAQDPNVLGIEGSRTAGMRDCHVSVGFVHADVVHRPPIGETGNNALIGIIDEGIDVLHEAFLDASGHTRILALWDQTGTGGVRPAAGYGILHTEVDINSYVATGKLPHSLQRDPGGHGTHVASIAAGRAVGSFAGGIAPDARIVAVITRLGPPAQGAPFSLGYSNSHIDALKFIQDFAHSQKMPVVVNVSLGMNAGAHDGTSALETAFDEFSKGGREPGYVIVKSAGNEHGMDGHARLKIAKHSKDDLSWSSKSVKRDEDVIELWFKPSDELRFRLQNPQGEKSAWVDQANSIDAAKFSSGNGYQLAFVRYHGDNGDSRLVVTVTPGLNVSGIAAGTWRLEIESFEIRSGGRIDAWVERIFTRPISFITHADEDMTLSIPATARTVIAVAAVQKTKPFGLFRASSYGPTRDGREKPDLAAPGEDVVAAESGTRNGVVSMSGTSMACPHVSGAIALLLSRRAKQCQLNSALKQLSAAQIRGALTQFTQNAGVWVPGMGFGVLDTAALVHAFD